METIVEENKQTMKDCDQTPLNVLSQLNKGFKRSKAEQILRLLKDQEALTTKFKEYDLDDGIGGDEKGGESDNWSLAGSDTSSVQEVQEVKPRKVLKKQKSGRSKTSMGFHKEDFSDFSSDTDNEGEARENLPRSRVSRHQSLNVKPRYRGNVDEPDVRMPVDYDVISLHSSRPKSSIASFSARSRRPTRLADTPMHISLSPRTDDPEVNKQRKRISNVKVDPLFRKNSIHGFGEADRKDSTKSDHCHTPTNLTPRFSSPRKIVTADVGPLDRNTTLAYESSRTIPSRPVCRSTSLAERGKYGDKTARSSRNVLSVDSNPLQSPREPIPGHAGLRRPSPLQPPAEVSQGQSRRPKSGSRNGRIYGDVSKTTGRTSLNMISERTHPVAVMKLPPLDASLKKVVQERDLICYGKEAMV